MQLSLLFFHLLNKSFSNPKFGFDGDGAGAKPAAVMGSAALENNALTLNRTAKAVAADEAADATKAAKYKNTVGKAYAFDAAAAAATGGRAGTRTKEHGRAKGRICADTRARRT